MAGISGAGLPVWRCCDVGRGGVDELGLDGMGSRRRLEEHGLAARHGEYSSF